MILEYPAPEAYAGVKYTPQFLAEVLGGIELRDWAARDRSFITAPSKVREVFLAVNCLGVPSRSWEGEIEIVYRPAGDQQFTVTRRGNKV